MKTTFPYDTATIPYEIKMRCYRIVQLERLGWVGLEEISTRDENSVSL